MYIRTKDGVYEVSSKQKNTYYVLNGRWQFEKQDILNQSENLAELCDVVVETKGTTGDYKHYIYEGERYEKLKPKIIDDIRTQDFNAYGAIWTSKGLIYVAKMNEKGELELI